MLTSSRESARRTGVELTIGFTSRQLIGQRAVAGAVLGLVAAVIGVPLGLVIFRVPADAVSTGIGVAPGWMAAPGVGLVAVIAAAAIALSATLGALATGRIAARPAADLVHGE